MADLNPNAIVNLTTTQLYDSEDGLRLMMDAIGVEICERNRIVNDGFSSMKEIIDLHTNDVDGFKQYLVNLNKTFASAAGALRTYFTPVNVQRLTGVVYYYNHSINNLHRIPDILMITEDDATAYSLLYRASTSDSDEDPDSVEIPELTGAGNWIDFRDKFTMKLSLIKGCRGVPLDYILDSTVRAATRLNAAMQEVNEVNIGDDDIFRTATTHFGNGYKADNKAVWDLLKANLLGRPPFNHISRFDARSNGRGAWETLKGFYQGVDFQERLRESAFNKLNSTFYKGETQRFSFEKYVEIHKSAHKELEDCDYNNGGGLDDATKIQHLRSGIKESAGLENALTHSRANNNLRTFDGLVAFLSAEVDHKNMRRKQLHNTRDRRVSSVHGKTKGNHKGNNKGNVRQSQVVDGLTVYAKSYAKEEFRKLTPAQRTAVIEMNRAKRRADKGKQKNGNNNNGNDALVSAINSLRDDTISMGDAIIAGVSRATGEDVSIMTDNNRDDGDTATSSKRKSAASGQVGDFIRQRRQKKGEN